MLQTVTGVYENWKVHLDEHLARKHARIIVTFLGDDTRAKTLNALPACFNQPITVERIKRFSRDELHER
jgi:hypothetical protein